MRVMRYNSVMRKNRSFFILSGFLLSSALFFVLLPESVSALEETITVTFAPQVSGNLTEVLQTIVDFFFTVSLIVAPVLLVIAGVIFMTAAGDPGKVAIARRVLLWTIIGFAVIVIAKGLIVVLKGIFGL
jgi:hypothetical protein